MKFICVPMGSAGDVHPLTWLGRVLAARGHEVVLVVQQIVEPIAQRSGLRYVTVGDAEEQKLMLANPALWHPRKAFPLIASAMPAIAREMLPVIEREIAGGGDTAILAGSLAFGARMAGEKHRVPVLSVHLQPSLMMSVVETPVMVAGLEWMVNAPRWLKRAFFGIVRWQVGKILGQPLVNMRREAGLAPATDAAFLRNVWHSPDGVLCLFPDWYAPKASDWPAHAVTTRFPLYDEGAVLAEDSALEQFLRAGDPPLLFTPGSANSQAATFLKEAVATCVKMRRRGILATRFLEQIPGGAAALPDHVKAFEYIPFGRVFPRCAAVIHHGGIGTTAQCLAAGAPQLIMAMAHDQPDNAYRVKRFGVGDYLYPKKFTAPRVAQKLDALLASPTVKAACATYREKVAQQISEPEMAALIETMVERGASKVLSTEPAA